MNQRQQREGCGKRVTCVNSILVSIWVGNYLQDFGWFPGTVDQDLTDDVILAAMQSQQVAFPMHFLSSLSPCSNLFPHPSSLSSGNQSYPISSQAASLATHQAHSAEDPWITHIGLAIITTWSCHHPLLHA